MSKRGPDAGQRPPVPPRAREAMVTLDLGAHLTALEAETLTELPAKSPQEPPLPFRSSPPRPSEAPSALLPSAAQLPSPSPLVSSAPPAALSTSVLLPPRSTAAPLSTASPPVSQGASPWAGARVRPTDLPLAPSTGDLAPPAMLASDAPPSRVARKSDPALPSAALTRHLIECTALRPDVGPRLRANWPEFTDEAAPAPSMADQLRAAFDPPAPEAPTPATVRRWSLRVMTRGTCSRANELRKALSASLQAEDDGEPPMRLATGELRLAFDELETLKATVAAAASHGEDDEAVAAAVAKGKAFLGDAALQKSRDAAAELTLRIRRATVEAASVDDGEIRRRVERTLVGDRAYSKRTLFGAKHLRASLVRDGEVVACYLPESMADALPLYAAFSARVIGEVFHRQDQDEESPVALLVGVLGRLIEKGDE